MTARPITDEQRDALELQAQAWVANLADKARQAAALADMLRTFYPDARPLPASTIAGVARDLLAALLDPPPLVAIPTPDRALAVVELFAVARIVSLVLDVTPGAADELVAPAADVVALFLAATE